MSQDDQDQDQGEPLLDENGNPIDPNAEEQQEEGSQKYAAVISWIVSGALHATALLIAAILTDQDLAYLLKVARALGLAVLVEVHDAPELERVLALDGVKMIGINNRDLSSFTVDLATTEQLMERFGERVRERGALLVSESGLFNRDDLDRVVSAGADAVLVGEALMRQPDVTAALETLIGG